MSRDLKEAIKQYFMFSDEGCHQLGYQDLGLEQATCTSLLKQHIRGIKKTFYLMCIWRQWQTCRSLLSTVNSISFSDKYSLRYSATSGGATTSALLFIIGGFQNSRPGSSSRDSISWSSFSLVGRILNSW